MLDINFIRDNPDLVKKSTKEKGFDVSVVDKVLVIDREYRELLQKLETARHEQNLVTEEIKKGDKDAIAKASQLKEQVKNLEPDLRNKLEEFRTEILKIPNLNSPDIKVGSEEDNEVIRQVGDIPSFEFTVRDHVDIGKLTDTIDMERGAKVAAGGFFYFKNELVLLELAIAQFALAKLIEKGFTPVITPNVAKERNVVGCGFQARSDKERQIYHLEGEDLDLIATAEITLVGMHTDEVLDEDKLPLKYVGYSSCYRKEIGSYGRDVRGILRVHEFKKVEMVVFSTPEESEKIHEELLSIEEEIYKDLGIPYQIIRQATGDLGNAAYKKYDLEAWMPSQNRYREITSTSNTTDFQARRLNIKYKTGGKNEYVHTLNGTLTTTSRTVIAIMENFQQDDGSVLIPEVLRKWVGKDKIEVKI